MPLEAGWYPSAVKPGLEQWFDGAEWQDRYQPSSMPAAPPSSEPAPDLAPPAAPLDLVPGWKPDPAGGLGERLWLGTTWSPETRGGAPAPSLAIGTSTTSVSSKSGRKGLLFVVVAAILLVGTGAVALVMSQKKSTHDLVGTMTLSDSDNYATDGEPCSGSGGYSDMDEGTQVTVSDGSGTVIATSSLDAGSGSSTGDCIFAFIVKDVPDASFYAIEVSHRGELKYSRAEMKDRGWIVFLTLGG